MNRSLYIKKLWLFPLFFVSLLLMGCQEEEYEVLTEEELQSLSRDSETFDLVMRTSMNDGTVDDEIDNSPCFSIDLPFELSVSGTRYTINSKSELSDFLNSRGRGNIPGTVEIQFPLTVTDANYRQIPLNNAQQFRALQQRCENDIALGDQPVTCAKIQYPVTVFVYDTRSQKTLSEKVNTKKQLFDFLFNLGDNQIFNFSFPIEVEVEENLMRVGNSEQLRNLIRECNSLVEIRVNGRLLVDNDDNFFEEIDGDFTGTGGSISRSFNWENDSSIAEYDADITTTAFGSFRIIVKDTSRNVVLDRTLNGSEDHDSFSGVTSSGTPGVWSVTITLSNFKGDGSFSLSQGD